MSFSLFLTLCLALIVSWSLFAIICSLIHEAFVQVKAERGRFLKKYLLQQLYDQPNGINWGLLLYNHGPIDLLSRAPEKPTNCISGKLFARSIIEVVGNSFTAGGNATPLPSKFQNLLLARFDQTISQLRTSDVQSLFNQCFQSAIVQSAGNSNTVDEALLYSHLETSLEDWFNQLMGRVSLWYEKKTRQRLFLLGVLLALLLNVDSIELFRYYRKYPADAQRVTQFYQEHLSYLHQLVQRTMDSSRSDSERVADQKTLESERAYLDSLERFADSINLPVGFDKGIFKGLFRARAKRRTQISSPGTKEEPGKQGPEDTNKALITDTARSAKRATNVSPTQSDSGELKTGQAKKTKVRYSGDGPPQVGLSTESQKPSWLAGALLKILGCVFSGFAASFGAPFWFNLLRKIISKTP